MRTILRLLALSLLLGAVCPTAPGELSDLRSARARWERMGLTDYAYDYTRSCFCGTEVTRPVTIQVRQGTVLMVIDRETGVEVANPLHGVNWPTVPMLFAEVERAVRAADHHEVIYHPVTGVPSELSIDWSRRVADDEILHFASNPRPLP